MKSTEMTREIRLSRWAEILHRKNESGLTVRDFCRENSLKEARFYYWQKKLRENAYKNYAEKSETSIAPATFARIKLTESVISTGKIIVRLDGAEIEIDGNTNADLIKTVITSVTIR